MSCEESWRECSGWLTRMGLLSADHRANWSGATIKDLAYTLRDGVQLCRLLNLVQPNALDLKEISQRPQMAQFLCLRNIRTFLQVCKNVFELKETDLFQPPMLFDLSDFGKVLSTLSKLSICPAAKRNGIPGFSAVGDETPIIDEEMCQNLEDLASVNEPTTPSIILPPKDAENEESIYEELCYITFRIIQPPVTVREKRDYVKGELLETETNYIDALNMLKKTFLKPLSAILKEEDRKIIFFGIKELSEIHAGFLHDLNRVLAASAASTSALNSINSSTLSYAYCNPQSKSLGDVFAHWKEKFVIYGDYCANLSRAQSLTEELSNKNEVLNLEIMKCEKEANGGRFKLRDLLSVPMQRILKYHLLLQKLLDETSKDQHGIEEFRSIEKARDAMSDVADFTNEVKRDSETLMIIRQIEGSIYDLKMPDKMELKDYGRLQKDGELRIRSHSDNRLKSRYVFVFDKVMLMCKTTRGEQYSYKHSLCLQEYRIEDVPGTTKKTSIRESRWSFAWNLVHHKEKNVYTMYAQTEEQKRRWIKAIEDALNNIQPEESRGTDHVVTMQTFEKGTNCNHCGKFLKGLFYQGYKCVRCDATVHRECIVGLRRCGTVQPPELPPRPPLLPIPPAAVDTISVSPKMSLRDPNPSPRSLRNPSSTPSSPLLPLNNLNSPCTANGMRLSIAQTSHHYVNLNHLENFPWFAGEMDRDCATSVLEKQENGTFLVRVRPALNSGRGSVHSVSSIGGNDATYALSLRWNDQVKHMKVLITSDEKLYYLSESRYFKSIVELVHWYQQNSLAESFSGLDACLERAFEKINCGMGVVHFDYNSAESPHQSFPFNRVPGTPS